MAESQGSTVSTIPPKALLLSLGALAIPVISAFNAPSWMGGDVEVLMWLTALLPAFGGKGMWGHHVHEAVLDSGANISGPTVHFVDEEYDTGSILAQWPVPVMAGDTPDTLAARVLKVEHLIYPLAVEHLCRAVAEGRDVPRPFPTGEAFQTAASFSATEIAGQIEAAFKGAAY